MSAARVVSGDTVPTEDEVRAMLEGSLAPPQPFPDEGSIFPIPTPAGVLLYRVLKANPSRITLVPLTPKETHEVVAFANQQARELAAWRVCLGVSVVAAHEVRWHLHTIACLPRCAVWNRTLPTFDDFPQQARAIVDAHPLPEQAVAFQRSWWMRWRRAC